MVKIDLYKFPQHIPEVNILNPKNRDQFILGDEIHINGTASDQDGEIMDFQLQISGTVDYDRVTYSYHTVDGICYWNIDWNTSDAEYGTYILKVIAYDNNLNDGYDEITIDLVDPNVQDIYSPTVSIDSPKDESKFLIGEIIAIQGSAKDNFGVVKLELKIGLEKIDVMSSYELNDWEFIWDTENVKEGEHEINIYAYDEANNVGIDTISVELEEPPVDQEIPKIDITSPTIESEYNAGEIIRIRGDASDDMSIAKIELSLDSKLTWLDITNSYISYNTSLNGYDIEGTWYYDWNTAGLDIGNYILYVRVYDGVDNSDSDILSVTLMDGQSPQVRVVTPGSGSNYQSGQIVKLSGKVTDDNGIEKLSINIDSANIQEDITKGIVIEDEDWYYDWITAETYPDGKYSITITATDVGGNQDSDMITVELTQPSEDKQDDLLQTPGFEVLILISAMIIILIIKRRKFL
jgi:hypothetical protein